MPLGAGSIAFTGFNADGGDNFSFVVLEAVAAGTTIQFTNDSWNGSAFGFSFADSSGWSWTATQDIMAGSVVTIDNLETAEPVSNLGAVAATFQQPHLGSFFQSGAYGESIIAFTGTREAPEAFLGAFSNGPVENDLGTLEGTGLVAGVNATIFSNPDYQPDVAAYVGPRTGFSSFAEYAAAISNPANWVTQEGFGNEGSDGIGPDAPFSRAGFSIDPAPQIVTFDASSLTVSHDETQAGAVAYTFTVERTGGVTGAIDFTYAIDKGASTNSDFSGPLVTHGAGQIADGATSATITILISGDTAFEADETFSVGLVSVSNAAASAVLGDAAVAKGEILNDDTVQVVNFAPGSLSVSEAEGNAGTHQYTFTVERSGSAGVVGDLSFSGSIGAGTTTEGDFGGAIPATFSGVILDGQTSATVTVTLTGDTLYEADETFSLTLLSTSNASANTMVGSDVVASATVANDDAQPSVVAAGETVTGAFVLTGNDSLTVEQGGALLTSDAPSIIRWQGDGGDVVVNNAGRIVAGGSAEHYGTVFSVLSPEPPVATLGSLTINNLATGLVQGVGAFRTFEAPGVLVINNAGKMLNNLDYALNFIDAGKKADITLNNLAGGVIGLIRGGTNVEINNAGVIRVPDDTFYEPGVPATFGGDAINYNSATGAVVHNLAGGLIEGSRHAVTGKRDMFIENDAFGVIVGRNGSAINVDNNVSLSRMVTVINHGLLQGKSANYEDSDGDAIDVDGLLHFDNYGLIQGLGANGYHDGGLNTSEGLAIGGGVINNYAGGVIYSVQRAIQVDNSDLGDAPAAVSIYNEGRIEGGDGRAISIIGEFADIVVNEGTILGSISTGGGDDVIRLLAGSNVVGKILAGAGNDRIDGAAGKEDIDGGAGSDWIEGGAGDDKLAGGADGDLFFFDNLHATGKDKITDFSARDVIVTTVKLRDGNGDGEITFGGNKMLDLGDGALAITKEGGAALKSLHFDGSIDHAGTTYFVYSMMGPGAGVGEAVAMFGFFHAV